MLVLYDEKEAEAYTVANVVNKRSSNTEHSRILNKLEYAEPPVLDNM